MDLGFEPGGHRLDARDVPRRPRPRGPRPRPNCHGRVAGVLGSKSSGETGSVHPGEHDEENSSSDMSSTQPMPCRLDAKQTFDAEQLDVGKLPDGRLQEATWTSEEKVPEVGNGPESSERTKRTWTNLPECTKLPNASGLPNGVAKCLGPTKPGCQVSSSFRQPKAQTRKRLTA